MSRIRPIKEARMWHVTSIDERKTLLVVGGAGYIGSHTAKALSRSFRVIVLDDLSRGHEWAVKWGDFHRGSLFETDRLTDLLLTEHVFGVFHFAASSLVGESVDEPLMYWRNNVAGTASLLEAMRRSQTKNFVFSSTAATYGEPLEVPIDEGHPQIPTNPYGWTKFSVERMLEHCADAYGLNYAVLRYFNAAGADPDGEIGEDHEPETHLIPIVLDVALGKREEIAIFGADYQTPDGTCIRDYVHVTDLACAHVSAFERLEAGQAKLILNLGNGEGHSVREVIETARRVTGHPIPSRLAERRPGDPARLVASSERARSELAWKPQFAGLSTIMETAWEWHRRHFSHESSSR